MNVSRIRIGVIVFSWFAMTSVMGQGAVEYMNELSLRYGTIKDDTWNYVKVAAHSRRARKIEKRRAQLIQTVKQSTEDIKKLNDFEGDASLRDATVKYLTINRYVLEEDYAKIVDLEDIAEDSYDAMEAFITAQKLARVKLSDAFEELDGVQNSFAESHGITIVDEQDKKSLKLKAASDAMDYYNKAYLIFFKSYKQELYIFDALNRNDLSSFEQNRKSLATFSEAGTEDFESLGSYDNDSVLKVAGKQLMQFYQQESKNELDNISEFLIKKDRMEKASKLLEAKKPAKRTQEEIDKYNELLAEYNAAVNDYNTTNQSLSKRRAQLLDNWNDKVELFFSKHVPK